MNDNLLPTALFVVLLVVVLASFPAQAYCDQEELCEAQKVVDELLEEIVDQHKAIGAHWKTLDSVHGWNTLPKWYDRTIQFVDVVSRYLRIGTLESRLLVAYSKLGSVPVAMSTHEPIFHCSDDIQLSAGF